LGQEALSKIARGKKALGFARGKLTREGDAAGVRKEGEAKKKKL